MANFADLIHELSRQSFFPLALGVVAIVVAILQTFLRFYREFIKVRRERQLFESEKRELSDRIISSLKNTDVLKIEDISRQLDKELLEQERPITWATAFQSAHERLIDEVLTLRSSARSHLLFGLAFSLFSLSALGVFAFFQNSMQINEVLSKELFYRIGFALLLQTVGFFFLRLYVKNHIDIKYYNNELTNLDMREAALRLCLDNKKTSVARLVEGLAKTERNFILKKNESSIFDDKREYVDNVLSRFYSGFTSKSKSHGEQA